MLDLAHLRDEYSSKTTQNARLSNPSPVLCDVVVKLVSEEEEVAGAICELELANRVGELWQAALRAACHYLI
jgi:hypothetical protein